MKVNQPSLIGGVPTIALLILIDAVAPSQDTKETKTVTN
jgi:hypothetical protein